MPVSALSRTRRWLSANAVSWIVPGVLLFVANGSIVHAAAVPAGFTESLVAGGLANPTAMEFAPDGRLFVCEQAGRVRVVKDGTLLSTPFVTLTVHSSGERGLLGIAFDPDFSSNQHIYLYYTATTPVRHNRISRFTANGDEAVAGSEVVLLDLAPLDASNHNGGAIHFGADGKLYTAVGDNAVSDNAQSFTSLNGKILRLNKDGTIPEDNPFYASASGIYRAIWALGLRNPFTFAVQPVSGELFINDVGGGSAEEINDGVAGANYGWPDTEGTTSDPRYQSPRYAYPHGGGVCAIVGGAFYEPGTTQFPAEYVGDYFFADYCAGWIRKLDPSGGGNTVVGFATGISSPVDLKVYDGALYYLARGGGSTTGVVYRIAYGGTPPAITTHPASQTVNVGDSATFSVGASGPAPLGYQWQRNGANIAGATAPNYTVASVAQTDDGARFRAVVSNTFGSTTSNEATLTVTSNATPTATITQPTEGTLYSGGNVITYAGTGMDPEDGTLPAGAFTWQIDFHHDTHTHPFVQPTTGATGGSFTIPTTDETSANVWYRTYLTVRDSGGRTHTVQRDILPRKSRITIDTNPSGLQVKLDGQPIATPASFDAVVGIVRTLEAISPQTAGSTTFSFESWSDGGAERHTVSTPSTDTTYVASYRAVPTGSGPVLEAHFDTGTDGFVYLDDAFRGTNQPNYAAGVHGAAEGFAGGALKVMLGGVNETDVLAISGGWSRTFTLPAAGPVTLSFRYNLTQTPEYESDEFSEMLVRVDALQPGSGGTDYVARLVGNGGGGTALTTGWQVFQVDLGTLPAGTHTVTVGGYNSKKTSADESTVVLIDDLVATATGGGGTTPVLTSITVTPASVDVPPNGTQQFTAQGFDQNGNPMAVTVVWTVSGGGSIDSSGRFTATSTGGPFTVTAQDGSVSGTASVTVTAPTGSATVLEAHFDAGVDGFVYLDDAFRGTNQPAYAAGMHAPAEGFAGGALRLNLGGINETDVLGISGGWSRSFTLSAAGPVTLSFRYQLTQTPEYEADEFSEVLVRVDGLQPGNNGTDYVARLVGNGSGGTPLTTGWQVFQAVLGTLPAGTHTLTVGGHNSKKTSADESTTVLIDDLVVTIGQ